MRTDVSPAGLCRTLIAHHRPGDGRQLRLLSSARQLGPPEAPHSYAASWWRKSAFTFSDATAAPRCQLRLDGRFQHCASDRERQIIRPTAAADDVMRGLATEHVRLKVPPDRIRRMIETPCFAT